MRAQARKTLDALTGARFLAAYWVLLYHFTIQFRYDPLPGKPATPHVVSILLAPILLQGHLGVDFFFLLSGFILAYTYLGADGELRGGKRAFWVARIARIYPVYLLGLIVALPDLLVSIPNALQGWGFLTAATAVHLLLLHAWIPVGTVWNQPSWSLSVEASFYLLFPFILPLMARLNKRSLWGTLTVSWLFFLALNLFLQAATERGAANVVWDWRDFARYLPIVSMPEFIAGTALGLLVAQYGADALPGVLRLAKRSAWICDALLIAVLWAVIGTLLISYSLEWENSPVDIVAALAMPPLIAIILLLAFQQGAIARILSTRVMVWLGEVSYAIYILQDPLWARVEVPFWALVNSLSHALTGHTANNFELLIAFSLLLVACASLSFKFLETPLRRWIRATWEPSDPRRSAAQPTPVPEGAQIETSAPR
jgi:peptidoglycan/LPS O-acetylase OafA/YrhL